MKTTTVNFGNFAQDAMTLTEMNFLRGGDGGPVNPDDEPKDLLIPPGEEREQG